MFYFCIAVKILKRKKKLIKKKKKKNTQVQFLHFLKGLFMSVNNQKMKISIGLIFFMTFHVKGSKCNFCQFLVDFLMILDTK